MTVNRPKVLNALNTPTWKDLRTAFEDARDDAAVRGVILTGAGDKASSPAPTSASSRMSRAFEAEQSSRFGQAVLDLIENLGKPVIAAINGFALGGGCETAMACTIRIAAETREIRPARSHARTRPGRRWHATTAAAGRQGSRPAAHSSGEMINAQEAYRIGLVNEIVPAADLITRAEAILKQVLFQRSDRRQVRARGSEQGIGHEPGEGLAARSFVFGLCAATEDKKEGTSAFLEKRAPQFHGR